MESILTFNQHMTWKTTFEIRVVFIMRLMTIFDSVFNNWFWSKRVLWEGEEKVERRVHLVNEIFALRVFSSILPNSSHSIHWLHPFPPHPWRGGNICERKTPLSPISSCSSWCADSLSLTINISSCCMWCAIAGGRFWSKQKREREKVDEWNVRVTWKSSFPFFARKIEKVRKWHKAQEKEMWWTEQDSREERDIEEQQE